MAAGIFRFIAGVCKTMIIANTGGALMLLLVFMLGGFILPRGQLVIHYFIEKRCAAKQNGL